MATIITKNSSTASSVPTNAQLVQGELAVNVTDKRLFTENASGTVVELGTNPSSLTLPNGTANGVAYLNGSKVLTTGSALTFDGTNLGIGTSSPGAKLDVADSTTNTDVIRFGASSRWAFRTGSDTRYLTFGRRNLGSGAADVFTFDGDNGNLGLGVTPSAWSSSWKSMEFGKAGQTIAGFTGADPLFRMGTNLYTNSGGTDVYAASSKPATQYLQYLGAHQWYTAPSGTAGNAISFTQAMTLDASGNLGVGTTSPYGRMTVSGDFNFVNVGFRGGAIFGNRAGSGTTSGTDFSGSIIPYDNNVGGLWMNSHSFADQFSYIAFATKNVERARIDSSGNLLVGRTGGVNNITYIQTYATSGSRVGYNVQLTNTTGASVFECYNSSGTYVGGINASNTGTSFPTSSDYRLKNIDGPLVGSGEFIDSLKPYSGSWKTDGSKFVGFLAHEVQEVSPSTVFGKKDAVNEQGEPVYQAMEYGSAEFIANIVAELQSLRKRVAALEATA